MAKNSILNIVLIFFFTIVVFGLYNTQHVLNGEIADYLLIGWTAFAILGVVWSVF